jgi:hypothetical protein
MGRMALVKTRAAVDDLPVTDPILIATWLSLGVCLTRALCNVGYRKPAACARCGNRLERTEAGEPVCTCSQS